jgi:hypothetical protein
MNTPCPRCGQNLIVHLPADDIEFELNKDFRWTIYGVAAFAVGSIGGWLVMIPSPGLNVPTKLWLSAVALATFVAALWLFVPHRRERFTSLTTGDVDTKSIGERIASVLAMNVAGIFAAGAIVLITLVAVFVLFVLTCFGNLKW